MDAFILVQRKRELFTIILDQEDYERLKGFNWHIARCSGLDRNPKYYARRNATEGGKRVKKYMHREITNALPGMVPDHKNSNGLDNRKANLLLTTQPDNARRQQHGIRRNGQR